MAIQLSSSTLRWPRKEWQKRTLSAFIMLAVALPPLFFGSWLFLIALLILSPLMVREWTLLSRSDEEIMFPLLLGGSLVISLIVTALYGTPAALGTSLFMCIIGLALSSPYKREFYFIYMAGLFLLPLSLVSLISIRSQENGLLLILWLILVISATDIMAYVVGRTLKGPKIAKKISPKKTWSGCLGGLLFAVTFALIATYLTSLSSFHDTTFLPMPFPVMITAFFVSLTAQIGDFFISFLKRKRNLKDTGKLIPGHGGLFDRFDSYLFAAPIMAFFIAFWDVVTL